MSRKLESACPRPCSACPWRTENHGKPHPHQLAEEFMKLLGENHDDPCAAIEVATRLASDVLSEHAAVGEDVPHVEDCPHASECGFCRARRSTILEANARANKLLALTREHPKHTLAREVRKIIKGE